MPSPSNNNAPPLPRLVPIAPAVNPPSQAQQQQDANPPELMPSTCVTCARRKVKCDKQNPCSACRKARLQCTYQTPTPRRRKRKPVEDIQDRLDRYERLLKTNNLLPASDDNKQSPGRSRSDGPPSPSSTPGGASGPQSRTGTLLAGSGKTRYVDSNIWSNLSDDLHPSSDEEEPDYDQADASQPKLELIDPLSGGFLGASSPRQSLLGLHPTYEDAMNLWKLYVRNVDPITKCVHLPTGLVMIQRAASNPSSMSKVTECLLFAIYHFAVISATERECMELFRQAKPTLAKIYYDAIRQALIGCSFLKTTELAILQAYALFLISVRTRYDPNTFWILTGVAVRIAQRMGLHCDGQELKMNPFDVHIRRRIFWQLLHLDGFAGQISGTGIAINSDAWDTHQPLNINDEDVWPDMKEQPQEKKSATEMIFFLTRTEIGKFQQKLIPALGRYSLKWEAHEVPALEKALQELESTLEEKYIRYCDITEPIHCMVVALSRGAVNSSRLRIRLPRSRTQGSSIEERVALGAISKRLLDSHVAIIRNVDLQRFAWHLNGVAQWDALIWILNEIRQDEPVIDVEAAWTQVEQVFGYNPQMFEQKRAINIALGRLTIKAWDAAQARAIAARSPVPEPTFITTLRSRVNVREASRQAIQTPDTPSNPFAHEDSSNDIQTQHYFNADAMTGYMSWNIADNINVDEDWMFWDQLMRDQEAGPQPGMRVF